MSKIQEMNDCGRAEQLVAYLYGESGTAERADFEGHLAACAPCREELSAFRQVRESVGAWRAELLTHAPAITTAELLSTATISRTGAETMHTNSSRDTREAATARRTAGDALREFFALSPAWLRYGSVAAALAVCALAALAILNARVSYANGSLAFSTGLSRTSAQSGQSPNAPQVETAKAGGGELNQLVAERDAALRELQDARAQLDDSRAANLDAVYREIDESQPDDQSTSSSPANAVQKRRAAGAQRKPIRRAQQSEDDLPRLIDLLSSGN